MKSIAKYLGIGILSFALAAAGSWYATPKPEDPADPAESAGEKVPAPGNEDESSETDAASADAELPVPVRAQPTTPEEIFRYGVALKNREKGIRQREEALKKKEQQIKLTFDDLRSEQQEFEAVLSQVQSAIRTADELLDRVARERKGLETQRNEAKKELEEFQKVAERHDELERGNVKRMSEWFESMPPEKSAEYLKELCNDGKIDTAVELLGNFEAREASKILAALNDPALVTQLAEKFKTLKRPEKKSRR